MKKLLSILLAVTLLLSLCACGSSEEKEPTKPATTYRVTKPMQYPNYVPSENPTPEELRTIAVRAMRDMLSVQWSPDKFFTYEKDGAVSGKLYSYVPDVTFCGMPYTNGGAGILQWLAYYDHETGIFSYPGDGQGINANLGNSCAACVCWGWSPVCASITGSYSSYMMTRVNGFLPVGTYTYPANLTSFKDMTTDMIVASNGSEVMLESYACIKMADGLTSTYDNHAIMAIEDAHVVRNDDGKINTKESYVMIQDQRAGVGDYFYEVEEEGETRLYSGRTEAKFTFEELLKLCYLPVTSAEFIGKEPYAPATVTFDGSQDSLAAIMSGKIMCNYAPCVLRAILTDEKGESEELAVVTFNSVDKGNGAQKHMKVSKLNEVLKEEDIYDHMKSGKTYTFSLEATFATSEVFTPVSITLKK